jgi:ATP-dependent DNA ligase
MLGIVPLPLLQPMLATSGQPAGDQALWSWEAKWEGWRAPVYLDGDLRVRTRTGRQVSDSLPELTGLVGALDGRCLILDGELVGCPGGVVDAEVLLSYRKRPGRVIERPVFRQSKGVTDERFAGVRSPEVSCRLGGPL